MQFARVVRATVIAALSAVWMLSAQAQTLVGDQIDAGIFRTVDTGYGLGRVLGYGLDAPFVVQSGYGDAKTYSSVFVLNVEALYFEVDFITLAGWQEGTVLRLTDFDFLETPYPVYLAGLAYIESNLVGDFTVTNTADSIEVAWGGTTFDENTYLKVFFPPSPVVVAVPEPETWALMVVGLASLGAIARRRRGTRSFAR
jgi:PEP-CTERM motif